MKLTPIPSMPVLRKQAKAKLREAHPNLGSPLSSEIELSALNLLEQFVSSEPSAGFATNARVSQSKLSETAKNYAKALTNDLALLANNQAAPVLSPALSETLEQVRWESLEERTPGFTMLGRLSEVSLADLATLPSTSDENEIEITGHWTNEQLKNVQDAVGGLGNATDGLALKLLTSIHIRTHLGDLSSGPILGLTAKPGPVSLRRGQTNNRGATRWLLFHEVGHQLDRFLSGSSQRFRSRDSDTPFGKSQHPQDYVDANQVSSAEEDFADCHAMAIFHHSEIQENPDLYLHARGELGKKMTWILKQAYGQEFPEPSANYQHTIAEVKAGHTPFSSELDFHHSVNTFLLTPHTLNEQKSAWLKAKLQK